MKIFFWSVGLSVALLSPTLWYPLGPDQGFFCYCAWAWHQFGLLPYRDFFESDFPGIFILHYFIQVFLGKTFSGLRIFDLAWQALAAVMIYKVSFSLFKDRRSAFLSPVIYAVAYLEMGPWHTAQRDAFLDLPYLASFWLLLRGKESPRRNWLAACSGILLGSAFTIKPMVLIMAGAMCAMVFATFKPRLKALALFALCFCLPSAAVLAHLWRAGTLHDFYQAVFLFNSRVYILASATPAKQVIEGVLLMRGKRVIFILVLGALILGWRRKKIPDASKPNVAWLVLMLLAAYIGYLMQGKYYIYHMTPLLGILSIFAGAGFSGLAAGIGTRSRVNLQVLAQATIIVLSLVLMEPRLQRELIKVVQAPPSRAVHVYPSYDACLSAAEFIRQRSTEEDRVQVLGMGAIINYLSQRRAPTRFASSIQLLLNSADKPSPIQEKLFKEFMYDLYQHPPLYFAVETLPYPEFGIISIKGTVAQRYPELKDFIMQNYTREKVFNFVELYRRDSGRKGSSPN